MKKWNKLIIISITIFLLMGCGKTNKNNDETIAVIPSEEEQLWIDSQKDEVYNQRIFLYDEYSMFLPDNQYSFNEDIDFLNSIRNENKFAEKFLKLLNNSTIKDILDSNNQIDKYVLFSYLSLSVNRCEGMCAHNKKISYKEYSDYYVNKIYYRDKSFNSKLEPIYKSKSSWPCFIFELCKDDNKCGYLYTNPMDYIDDKDTFFVSSMYTTLDYVKSETHKYWVECYVEEKEHEFNWVELDGDIIDKVINNNKSFLDFYIKYKRDYYYPRYDLENPEPTVKYNDEKKVEPYIGMSKKDVLSSTWGKSSGVNKYKYAWGTEEQWVYDKGYIYIKDGKVYSISEYK